MIEPGMHLYADQQGQEARAAERAPEMQAWTTPRTWVTGETLTSTLFNTHIRDNLAWLGGTDAFSTSPPGVPVDRQLWIYPADATNGILWPFRYDAGNASGFKWEAVGPGALIAYNGAHSTNANAAYVDPTNNASVAVPRAGDYLVHASGFTTGSVSNVWLTLKKGAAATADADAVAGDRNVSGGGQARSFIVTGLAISDVLKFQHKIPSGTIGTNSLNLVVRPIRVS